MNLPGFRLARIAALAGKLRDFSPRAVYGWLGGRHFLLCCFFAITAAYFEWKGKLEPSYAAAITAIAGFAVWRAVSEDRKDEHDQDRCPPACPPAKENADDNKN